MYKKILVAIDESERAFKALECAVSLSENLSAKLVVLYISKTSLDTTEENSLNLASIEEKIKNKTHLHAKELWFKINSSFPELAQKVEFVARKNKNIAKAIIDVANEGNCDLIVLGSRQLPGASSIILRSVTNDVLGLYDKSVLVVR